MSVFDELVSNAIAEEPQDNTQELGVIKSLKARIRDIEDAVAVLKEELEELS